MEKKEPSHLQRLTDAVAAYYKEKGDKTISGVVVAHLPGRGYYASVARYPDSPYRKEIVVKTSADDEFGNPESAIEDLAYRWLRHTGDLDTATKIQELKKGLGL